MQLKPLQVTLDQLMLDPNNPRLARSLNLRESLDDSGVIGAQTALIKLFENNNALGVPNFRPVILFFVETLLI